MRTHEINHPQVRGQLQLEAQLTTDRAGNAVGTLFVTLDEGTLLRFVAAPVGELSRENEVLAAPVQVAIRFDPEGLARLAVVACVRKGRRSKVGPLQAVAPRQLPTKRVPR